MDKAKRRDEAARIFWVIFLVVWFSYSLVKVLGCSDSAKMDIADFFKQTGKCELRAAEGTALAAEQHLLNDMDAAIAGGKSFDSQDWTNEAKSLGLNFGVNTIKCLASSLYNEVVNPASANADMGMLHAKRRRLKPEYKNYLIAVFKSN